MKTVLTAIALSTLSALSFADATQFTVPAGQLSRAEVIAAIGKSSPVAQYGDATDFHLPMMASTLTRAQVLAEAAADRAARRDHGESNSLRFADADPAVSLTRAEVMADYRRPARFGDANRDDINLRTR